MKHFKSLMTHSYFAFISQKRLLLCTTYSITAYAGNYKRTVTKINHLSDESCHFMTQPFAIGLNKSIKITCVGAFSTRMCHQSNSDCWLARKTCALLKVRIVRQMVANCDLLTKTNWDHTLKMQVSTVSIRPWSLKRRSS